MALLGEAVDFPIRPANKEPEWSSLCNNVFDQYLDSEDLFAFELDPRERSSSNDSQNLFDFSTGSEQSHQTNGTSPIPSWDYAHGAVAEQPRAQEPVDFWTKTLRALEQNAAASEQKQQKQQKLRTAKSHPDFLSLGGCPSPPAIPSSPTDQSFSVQRRRGRNAANGRKASQARSVSRGRPSGVTKPATTNVNPYATVRKSSASPSKMMNPSRYRAGFKDIWAERTSHSPKKYELRVPSGTFPASPPPSARTQQEDDFAAFGSPSYVPLSAYDDQLSPLTTTFQQATIHTPLASPPAINAAAHAANSYFSDIPPVPQNPYQTQTVPLNDTAPLFPERTSSLVPHKIQHFDFGFSTSPDIDDIDPFSSATFAESATAHYTTSQLPYADPFSGIDAAILPSTEANAFAAGLGISCDPSLVSGLTSMPATVALPTSMYQGGLPSTTPYYGHPGGHVTMPNTPHRRSDSCLRSESPSPTPTAEPRSRRASSKSRRSSRHRRTKSTNSTPHHPRDKDKGGFVNFTPHDSNKILSGVAPSGSSKTKARREKEAADKRRRLSQAAIRAVVEAGGDVDTLAKAGLLA